MLCGHYSYAAVLCQASDMVGVTCSQGDHPVCLGLYLMALLHLTYWGWSPLTSMTIILCSHEFVWMIISCGACTGCWCPMHVSMFLGSVLRCTVPYHCTCMYNYTLQKLKGSFNLSRVISVAASSPDNVQTSADQQIILFNPFKEAQWPSWTSLMEWSIGLHLSAHSQTPRLQLR